MEKALAAVRLWPKAQQDEAAGILLALDRLGPGEYEATEDELRAIDEGLEQARRGEFVSNAEIEAMFARTRR